MLLVAKVSPRNFVGQRVMRAFGLQDQELPVAQHDAVLCKSVHSIFLPMPRKYGVISQQGGMVVDSERRSSAVDPQSEKKQGERTYPKIGKYLVLNKHRIQVDGSDLFPLPSCSVLVVDIFNIVLDLVFVEEKLSPHDKARGERENGDEGNNPNTIAHF